jgi:DNA-binding response OmpR family regulator
MFGQKKIARKKILYVDDEPQMLQIVKMRLEAMGFETITAQDGEIALRKAAELKPDIAVLDQNMAPLDGIKVCQMLQSNPHTLAIPVIIFTCEQTRELEARCIQAGAKGVVYKPLVGELVRVVRKLLEGGKLDTWAKEDS